MKIRRLFSIEPKYVSIVDKGANQKKFIIVKRKEGEDVMDGIKEVLENIQKALNDIDGRLKEIESGKEEFSIDDVLEYVNKKGAKFSGKTLTGLRQLRDSLSEMLKDSDMEKDDKIEVSVDDIVREAYSEIYAEKNKSENSEDEKIAKIVKSVVEGMKK